MTSIAVPPAPTFKKIAPRNRFHRQVTQHTQKIRQHRRGMTLLELLVAVALLAISAPLVYHALSGVLRANEQAGLQMEHWQSLSLLFARIETDVGQALARPVRGQDGAMRGAWMGDSAQFEFTAAAENRPPVRQRYTFHSPEIQLQQWPVLDRGQDAEPAPVTVQAGVTQAQFRYMDSSGSYRTTWNDPESLPRAVAIELTLSSGEQISRVFALP